LEARKSQAIEIAVETFDALVSERGDSGKIWASALKQAIKRRKPGFNESYYGFRAFGNLLEEAQARGLLELGRDEKSGAYVYRSSGGKVDSVAMAELALVAPVSPEIAVEPTVAEETSGTQTRRRRRGSRKLPEKKTEVASSPEVSSQVAMQAATPEITAPETKQEQTATEPAAQPVPEETSPTTVRKSPARPRRPRKPKTSPGTA